MKLLIQRGVIIVIVLVLSGLTVLAQDTITVSMWVFEGEADFLPQVIAEFEAANPGIKIEVTDIPEGEYVTKIDTALIAGEPPDIGFVYVPRWIKAGYFLPLDEVLEANGINVADFNQGAIGRDCIVDGVTYCIGTYTGAILLFYNKDLFDQANLPYPSPTEPMTIAEYAEIALALSNPSSDLAERVWGGEIDITYWWHDWRNLVGEEGRRVDGYVNDEATISAYEAIAAMLQSGAVMTAAEQSLIGANASVDLLATGRLASAIIDNIVAIPLLEQSGIRWGAAVVPVEQTGDAPWTTTWTDAYGVFSLAKQAEAAQKFLVFMATEGNQIQLEKGNLPLNISLAVAENWAGDSEGRQEVLAAIQLAKPNLFVPDYWDMMGLLSDGFYGMVIEDGMSVREMMAEVVLEMQQMLDNAWATWDSIE